MIVGRYIGLGRLAINGVLAAPISTSAFAWISVAVNYDILSLLMILLVAIFSIKYLHTKQIGFITLALIFALLVSITKYTYMPLVFFMVILSFIYAHYKDRFLKDFAKTLRATPKVYRKNPVVGTILFVALIVSSALFIERIGVNLVQYKSNMFKTVHPRRVFKIRFI